MLSALKNGEDDPLKSTNRTGETKRLWVGVGQLPLISMGSVWHKKAPASEAGGTGGGGRIESFEIDTLRTKPFKAKAHRWNEAVTVDDKVVPCLPGNYYFVGKENYPYLADSLLWVYSVRNPRYSVVLIPPYEILRSYYLSSNKVARAVFEDDIGLLIDTDESEVLDDRNVYLSLLKTTDGLDAWFIARWLASEKTGDQISLLNRSFVAASVNATPHSDSSAIGAHIETDFPFDGTTKLTAAGKHIKLHPGNTAAVGEKEIWGFLVLNILNCTHPMPYRDVATERKNDARKGLNSDDPDLPTTAFPGPPPTDQVLPPSETSTIGSDEEPDKSARALLQETFNTRFADLVGRKLVEDPKIIQRYKSGRKGSPSEKEFTQQGTGEGTTGQTSTGKVDVKQELPFARDKLPTDVATFLQVIKYIRAVKKRDDWTVTTVQVHGRGQPIDDEDVVTSFRTKVKGQKSWITWHLKSRYPDIPRTLIIAKVEAPSGISYIIEMERKKEQEKRSVLILYSENRTLISDATMDLFLTATAKENGWPSQDYLPFLRRAKVNHGEKRTIQSFATAILKKMELSF